MRVAQAENSRLISEVQRTADQLRSELAESRRQLLAQESQARAAAAEYAAREAAAAQRASEEERAEWDARVKAAAARPPAFGASSSGEPRKAPAGSSPQGKPSGGAKHFNIAKEPQPDGSQKDEADDGGYVSCAEDDPWAGLKPPQAERRGGPAKKKPPPEKFDMDREPTNPWVNFVGVGRAKEPAEPRAFAPRGGEFLSRGLTQVECRGITLQP